MQIYCTDDYNLKKAPKCSFCKKPIVPKEGQKTAPRLRALGRDYHPQCFQCEVGNLNAMLWRILLTFLLA